MKYFFIILIVIILFISCHKEDESLYYSFSPTTLKYVFFHTGSSWVYQDSATGFHDSIVVSSMVYNQKISNHPMPPLDNTYYYDELLLSYEDNFYHLTSENISGQSYLTRHYMWNGVNVSYPLYNEKYMDVGSVTHSGDHQQTRSIVAFFNEYTVKSNTFYDVYLINIDDIDNGVTTDYYLAKNTGIIKKVVSTIDSTKTWDLIDWYVLQ